MTLLQALNDCATLQRTAPGLVQTLDWIDAQEFQWGVSDGN